MIESHGIENPLNSLATERCRGLTSFACDQHQHWHADKQGASKSRCEETWCIARRLIREIYKRTSLYRGYIL